MKAPGLDGWTFQIGAAPMLERTKTSKLGFEVGEVTLAFRKR